MKHADHFDLSGHVALVTGGSRGLGREMVKIFAGAGADVAIVSRDQKACEAVADEVRAAFGVRALGLGAHIGHWEALTEMVDTVHAELGAPDILVNNAGMSPPYDTPDSISEALFDKVLDVNLKGPFRLAVIVAARMQETGGGSIINISSAASLRPRSDSLPYSAAKAGLNAVTIGLAHAYGPTVRVNAIIAGTFLTDISRSWDQDAFARRSATFAAQRGGLPDEIAGMALYLASDASSYTTGALLSVDGGQP